jgi:hypothetical protein
MTRAFAELLIDCGEDRTLRAYVYVLQHLGPREPVVDSRHGRRAAAANTPWGSYS